MLRFGMANGLPYATLRDKLREASQQRCKEMLRLGRSEGSQRDTVYPVQAPESFVEKSTVLRGQVRSLTGGGERIWACSGRMVLRPNLPQSEQQGVLRSAQHARNRMDI